MFAVSRLVSMRLSLYNQASSTDGAVAEEGGGEVES